MGLWGCGAGYRHCLQQLVLSLSHLGAIAVPKARRLLGCSRSNDAVSLGPRKSRRGVEGGQMWGKSINGSSVRIHPLLWLKWGQVAGFPHYSKGAVVLWV